MFCGGSSRPAGSSSCSLATLALLSLTTLAAGPAAARRTGAAQEYRIGAKDVLKVTIWGHEDLSRQVVVVADGTFQFPLIGDVPACPG